jgi:hypothetical protein
VQEFHRLGGREPIDACMLKLGVQSIHDLKPEQYQLLIDEVRAL